MNNISADKVTKPIQLLAAWLVGLVIINGEFLAVALKIENPTWASGALVISSILSVPIFLISIFVLQTKFRAEMQGDEHYSEYLKSKNETIEYSELKKTIVEDIKENISELNLERDVSEKITHYISESIEVQDFKGVLFDTNKSYSDDAIWEMMEEDKVAAYGSLKGAIDYLDINDMIFYIHQKRGLIAVAKVIENNSTEDGDEKYKKVDFLSKKPEKHLGIKCYMTFKEIKDLLNKNFYWAKTLKVPYLSKSESEKLLRAFNSKCEK